MATTGPVLGRSVFSTIRALEVHGESLPPAGTSSERLLSPGDGDSYLVSLKSGEYLQLEFSHSEAKLMVRIFDAANRLIVDCVTREFGVTVVSALARTSGQYRVNVKTAGNATPYQLKVAGPRKATAIDNVRVFAETAFAEAEQQRVNWKARSVLTSIAKYKIALSRWAEIGEEREQARALNTIGYTYYDAFSDMGKAKENFNEALKLWRHVGDSAGEAETLLNLGYVNTDLDESSQALDYFSQSLAIWRQLHAVQFEARTLSVMGLVHAKLGEYQKALNLYAQSLALSQAVGDRQGEGLALNGMAQVYSSLNETQKELDFRIRALQMFEATGNKSGAGITLYKVGVCQSQLGDNEKALDSLHRSVEISRSVGDDRVTGYALRYLGNVYGATGNVEKALDYYREALTLDRRSNNRRETAYALNDIGRTYYRLGKKDLALKYFQRALPLNRITKDAAGESLTLCNLARAQRDTGSPALARATIEEAIRISENLRAQVASPEMRSSYLASVHQQYEIHADLLMQLHKQHKAAEYEAQAFQVSERAHARSLLETLSELRADIREGVDIALLEREKVLQRELDIKAQRRTAFLSAGSAKEAQEIDEELRNLTTQYTELQGRIRASSPRYAMLTQPQPLTLKEIQHRTLDNESILLEYMLGEDRSYVWAVTQTEISGYELPPRAQIELAARKLRDLLNVHQSLANETFEQRQTRIKDADAQYPAAAAALSDMLIAPVHHKLGRKRLLIVPDGALHYIPFQALMVPSVANNAVKSVERIPLLANHEIVYEPSASALAFSDSPRPAAQNTIAVFANPVFEADDPRVKLRTHSTGSSTQQTLVRGVFRDFGLSDGRIPALPASREEAEAIMSFVPWGTGLKAMGFDANRRTASQPELAQYRVVHFATHGFVDYEHPELSGLILSLVDQNGQPQEGHLRLHDIYNLKLSANLVVLSACNTGLGKEIKGEGLIGLTRGFMYAGADSVVASLWKVDDDATAALMARFYQGMFVKGLPPAAALREAQLWMWQQERWRAPYFWAAFTIQGRYDQTEIAASANSRAHWLVTSGGLFGGCLLAACLVYGRRRSRTL